MTTTIRKRRTYTVTGALGRKLRQAEQLTIEIARLKEQLDPLREEILDHMIKQDLAVCEAGNFTAIRKQRHNWEYSAHCKNEKLALTNLQQWEQQQGTAIDTPTTYLQLTTKP